MVKGLPANAGDARDSGSITVSGRSPGVGNGNLLQYSYLENSTGRGVHGVAKSWTELSTQARCKKIINVFFIFVYVLCTICVESIINL